MVPGAAVTTSISQIDHCSNLAKENVENNLGKDYLGMLLTQSTGLSYIGKQKSKSK